MSHPVDQYHNDLYVKGLEKRVASLEAKVKEGGIINFNLEAQLAQVQERLRLANISDLENEGQVNALTTQVRRLTEALRKHGKHEYCHRLILHDCDMTICDHHCSCGLTAALAERR